MDCFFSKRKIKDFNSLKTTNPLYDLSPNPHRSTNSTVQWKTSLNDSHPGPRHNTNSIVQCPAAHVLQQKHVWQWKHSIMHLRTHIFMIHWCLIFDWFVDVHTSLCFVLPVSFTVRDGGRMIKTATLLLAHGRPQSLKHAGTSPLCNSPVAACGPSTEIRFSIPPDTFFFVRGSFFGCSSFRFWLWILFCFVRFV